MALNIDLLGSGLITIFSLTKIFDFLLLLLLWDDILPVPTVLVLVPLLALVCKLIGVFLLLSSSLIFIILLILLFLLFSLLSWKLLSLKMFLPNFLLFSKKLLFFFTFIPVFGLLLFLGFWLISLFSFFLH